MSWSTVRGEGGGKFDSLFKFKAEVKHRVRFLTDQCISMWVHNVPSVSVMKDGRPSTIRGYRTYLCNFEDEGRICHSGLCDMDDPMWDALGDDDKYGRTDNKPDHDKPSHFRKSVTHIIPLWNYETEKVELLRQGNKLFGLLGDMIDARGTLQAFDVQIWKTGNGFRTEYKAAALQDTSFEKTDGIKAEQSELELFIANGLFSDTPADIVTYVSGAAPNKKASENKISASVTNAPSGEISVLFDKIMNIKDDRPDILDDQIIQIVEGVMGKGTDIRTGTEEQLITIYEKLEAV